MAVRGEVFDSAGGFDERFALYFEETDFLRRVASSRGRIVSVPGARCRHLYNQSAGQDPDRAGRLFAQSELRYFAKWNGPFLASVMKRLEKPRDPDSRGVWRGERIEVPPGMLVEASPLASFETAAGHFAQTATVALPREVTDVFRGEAIHLRVVDPSSGEVLSPSRSVS